jgi:hypothetical protein
MENGLPRSDHNVDVLGASQYSPGIDGKTAYDDELHISRSEST